MASFTGAVTEGMIPAIIRTPLVSGISPDAFTIRLREGGKLEFRNATHELTGGGFGSNTYTFWGVDELILQDSKIITNGNTLIIFCNRLSSERSSIVSFEGNATKAKAGSNAIEPGGNGEPGEPGDDGGLVSIHVVGELVGHLGVYLSAQAGGNGGDGSDGAAGRHGAAGTDSRSGVSWSNSIPPHPTYRCTRQAGRGGRGTDGNPGGVGGDGGDGGSGGILQLFNVGAAPIPAEAFEFVGTGGGSGNSREWRCRRRGRARGQRGPRFDDVPWRARRAEWQPWTERR